MRKMNYLAAALMVLSFMGVARADVYSFVQSTIVTGSTNVDPYGGGQDTALVSNDDVPHPTFWPLGIYNPSLGAYQNIVTKFTGLDDYLPENFQVTSARVSNVFYQNQFDAEDMDVAMYELLVGWDESTAKWTSPWTTGGAEGSGTDRAAAVMDTTTILADAAAGDVYWWDVDTALVQSWIDNDSTNYGLLFKTAPGDNTLRRTKWGAHNATASYRPTLEITGSVVTTVPEPATLGLVCIGTMLVMGNRRTNRHDS